MRGRLLECLVISLALFAVAASAASAEAKAAGKQSDTVINVAAASPTLSGIGTIATETARCPAKTRALGGGFLGGGGIVFESRMIGVNAWRVSVQSRTGHLFGLVTYAYCRKGAPKTSAVSRTAVARAAGPGPSLVTSCPGKKKALAGGFSTAPPVGSGLIDIAVTDSLRQGAGGWLTEALSGRAGPSVTGFAYCAKRRMKRTAMTGTAPTVTGVDTPTTAVSPSCGKKTAVMGGFSVDGVLGFGVAFPQYGQSQRAHKTWHTGANDIGGGPLTVSATAYCG